MGFRFRKSIKLAPGVRLNLGKKSASISFGTRGLRHTISTSGRRTVSIGVPGTGIYYTKSSKVGSKLGSKSAARDNSADPYQEVAEFEEALEYITSLHEKCDYGALGSNSKRAAPFKAGDKGPNELSALEKLESFKPSILGRVLSLWKRSEGQNSKKKL